MSEERDLEGSDHLVEGAEPVESEVGEALSGEGAEWTGLEERRGGGPDPYEEARQRWDNLDAGCRSGLEAALSVAAGANPGVAAKLRLMALDRALAAAGTMQAAATGQNIDWTILAAIGIRETGFLNIRESQNPAGMGRGVFQIDIGANPSVTEGQAMNFVWATDWAIAKLTSNRASLSAAFPQMSQSDLTAAMIATWNHGLAGVSTNLRNGVSVDQGTTNGNYSANVLNLQKCF